MIVPFQRWVDVMVKSGDLSREEAQRILSQATLVFDVGHPEAEDLFVIGHRIGWAGLSVGALVGNRSEVLLNVPAAAAPDKGTIAIVQPISLGVSAAADVLMGPSVAVPGAGAWSAAIGSNQRDTRMGDGLSAGLVVVQATRQAAASSIAQGIRFTLTAGGSLMIPPFHVVLGPGTSLAAQPNADNIGINASWVWREVDVVAR